MRRRRSTFAERLARGVTAAVLALALALRSTQAHAQACCVAPGATATSRLAAHEAALAGVDARAASATGSLDAAGRFRRLPPGARDVVLEQSLFSTVRLLERGQVSVTIPFVQTLRSTSGSSSAGGGLGDIRASARWDLVFSERARPFPGVAILGGASAPTGTPPERAGDALGTGATGTGTPQGWAGLGLEQTSGPWYFGGSATVTLRAPREIGAVRSSLPPRFGVGIVGAHAWTNGAALSLATAYEIEDRASADGLVVPGSARRAVRLTIATQIPLAAYARLIGSIYAVPPLPAVTAGETSTLGLSLAVVVPWT